MERLGEFQRRARTHAQIARQGEQRLLVLVLGHQQRLLVVGKLHLRAQHVHAGRGSGVVLVFGQLVRALESVTRDCAASARAAADCAFR